MTWEDFIEQEDDDKRFVMTDIECPKCGRPMFVDTGMVLTSDPPQYIYQCICGYHGYSRKRWF